MSATAARSLGYRVHTLDPDPQCPARYVVERCVTASFDDEAAAEDLARHADVVTFEIEKIGLRGLERAARVAPVRPGPELLAMVQDRARQKAWLVRHGFAVGPYAEVRSLSELEAVLSGMKGAVFLKLCSGGYDGRGQFEIAPLATRSLTAAAEAWHALGGGACVAEEALSLEAELSVMVARNPGGAIAVYPPALNHHERRILAWSVLPAALSIPGGMSVAGTSVLTDDVLRQATDIARSLAEESRLEGLLATEFFLTTSGKLFVNELSPRPHNSFHATEMACLTSQFEQHVRAVCNLPLGAVEAVRSAAIVNLLGDLWSEGAVGASAARPAPPFDEALAVPGVRLFLYGKSEARPGRKMGHLCAAAETPDEAVRRVLAAYEKLRAPQQR
jgi:5-(carboxyamino)imidazole ribonucleotide synthase